MKLRKLNRIVHRDLGYIFFGFTVIYALSGIALNHLDDWNPNYILHTKEFTINNKYDLTNIDKQTAINITNEIAPQEKFKNFYYPSKKTLKIFVKNGNIIINTETKSALLETSKKRPIFHQLNYLHYNPKKWWTLISDTFAIALIILAISGLFIIKGKKGITGRGAWLTAIGIFVPILFLLIYYWKIF